MGMGVVGGGGDGGAPHVSGFCILFPGMATSSLQMSGRSCSLGWLLPADATPAQTAAPAGDVPEGASEAAAPAPKRRQKAQAPPGSSFMLRAISGDVYQLTWLRPLPSATSMVQMEGMP